MPDLVRSCEFHAEQSADIVVPPPPPPLVPGIRLDSSDFT